MMPGLSCSAPLKQSRGENSQPAAALVIKRISAAQTGNTNRSKAKIPRARTKYDHLTISSLLSSPSTAILCISQDTVYSIHLTVQDLNICLPVQAQVHLHHNIRQ